MPPTTAVRSWLKKSRKKNWANQTTFGMGSDILSTHPSGRKTSAACFESIPTHRLVYNFKFLTTILVFYFWFRKIITKLERPSPLKKYLVSENSIWITHLKRLYVMSLRSRFYYNIWLQFLYIENLKTWFHFKTTFLSFFMTP